jgi:hypothetical protein
MMRIRISRIVKTVGEGRKSRKVSDHVGALVLSADDDFTVNDSSWVPSSGGERIGGAFALAPDEKRIIAEAVKKGLKEGRKEGEIGGFLWQVQSGGE